MKRTAGLWMLLAALGGCMTMDQPSGPRPGCGGRCGGYTPSIPGVQGPHGEPVAMSGPFASLHPGASAAQNMLAYSVPLEMVQANPSMPGGIMPASASMPAGGPSGIMQAGGPVPPGPMLSPPGLPGGPGCPPPPPPGAVAAVGAIVPGAVAAGLPNGAGGYYPVHRTSVRFLRPDNMKVSWYVPSMESRTGFATQLNVPGRFNFIQAAIYRLKLSNIPGWPTVNLYPTLEVAPANLKTEAFLAHSSVPITFTDEDFEQVRAGNYLVKVIYLPDPAFQDLATVGPDEIVSTRLDPGVDPLAEARRRGTILLVVRLGNIDLENPHSPPMDAPNPYAKPPCPPMGPGCPPAVPPGLASAARPPMMGQGAMPPAMGLPDIAGTPTAAPTGVSPVTPPVAGTPTAKLPEPVGSQSTTSQYPPVIVPSTTPTNAPAITPPVIPPMDWNKAVIPGRASVTSGDGKK